MWDDIGIIAFRLFLALIFSGLIGYEREVAESSAGLKTHILVAIGATLIALIQVELIQRVQMIASETPAGLISVTTDASRLIAQVVSGIGFLGAGAIIVTKSHISGLTTAASIWTVAGIGLALGMGFYPVAIFGFLFVILTLFIFKRFVNINRSYSLIIKYVGGIKTLNEVKAIFEELNLDYEMKSYKSDYFVDHVIRQNIFKVHDNDIEFQELVTRFSTTENIVSVERSNLPN